MLLEKPPDVCAVHLFAIHTWTPKMVEFWLCRLNVDGSIIKRFQEERIRGRHLHRLTENHLERLGCGNMGDRFDILNAISSIPPVGNVCVGVGQRKQVGPPFRPPWSRVKPRVNNLGAPSTLDLNIAADLLDYVLEHFTSFEFDHTTIFNILDFLYGHYDPPGKSSIGRSKQFQLPNGLPSHMEKAARVFKMIGELPARTELRKLRKEDHFDEMVALLNHDEDAYNRAKSKRLSKPPPGPRPPPPGPPASLLPTLPSDMRKAARVFRMAGEMPARTELRKIGKEDQFEEMLAIINRDIPGYVAARNIRLSTASSRQVPPPVFAQSLR